MEIGESAVSYNVVIDDVTSVEEKYLENWCTKIFLDHDNVHSLLHPLCLPDLVPSDLFQN